MKLVAHWAGVLPRNFGQFVDVGYEGLYGGLNGQDLKEQRGLPAKADVLDYIGSIELAASHFRVTQTTGRLVKENIIGQSKAIETHREVGQKVRKAIEDIGGTMPEDLPTPKESIKQLKRGLKKKNCRVLNKNSWGVLYNPNLHTSLLAARDKRHKLGHVGSHLWGMGP